MEQNRTKLTLVNLAALLAAGIATLIIAQASNAYAAYAALPFLGLGVLITAISYFHMRLVERERIEQLEYDELTKSPSASALFNKSELESLPAKRSRRQFEKYFIPGFTILLLLAEVAAVFLLWRWLAK